MRFTTLALTALAMLAFAANSLLCRLALGAGLIDAASFASVRVASGALFLSLLIAPRLGSVSKKVDWRCVAALFGYMSCFSYAYISLNTGTGALILFGAVQLTMLGYALVSGERLTAAGWLGLGLAVSGMAFLVSPGLTAPDPKGAGLMAIAGVSWGAYSLFGRHTRYALPATAKNFIFCIPLVLIVSALDLSRMQVTPRGAILAVVSGALASGAGYAIWYRALAGLTASRAATVQLSVPVIAAIGGVALLSEPVTTRLIAASTATLGGVALVLAQRASKPSTE